MSFSFALLLFSIIAGCIADALPDAQIPQRRVAPKNFQAGLRPSRNLASLLFARSPSLARWSQVPSVAVNNRISPPIAGITSSRASSEKNSVALQRTTKVKTQENLLVAMLASLGMPLPIENLLVTMLGTLFGPKPVVRPGQGIEIREVKGKGRGAFATRDIPAGVVIGRYTGKLLTWEDAAKSDPSYYMEYFGLSGEDGLIVDGKDERKSSWTRFINHSKRKANCLAVHIDPMIPMGPYIETTRPISAGQEILFDYGGEYWDGQGFPVYNPQRFIIDYL